MRIEDIMTRRIISVEGGTPIAQIAELLTRGGYHALPVVDSKKRLIGIVTVADVIKLI